MEVTIGETGLNSIQEKAKDHFSDSCPTNGFCPVSDVIDRISDKWSVHAIIKLGKNGRMRFSELKKEIHGISQRMLTVTLRNLEQDGLLTRTIYPEIPPRVEYELTDLGLSLLDQLMKLSEWASENMNHIFKSREDYILRK